MIIKKVEQEVVQPEINLNERFNIYKEVEMPGVDGNTVMVLQLVQNTSIRETEEVISQLTNQIAKIQASLDEKQKLLDELNNNLSETEKE